MKKQKRYLVSRLHNEAEHFQDGIINNLIDITETNSFDYAKRLCNKAINKEYKFYKEARIFDNEINADIYLISNVIIEHENYEGI